MDQAPTQEEQKDTNFRENPYFRISQLGVDIWNNWIRTTCNPDFLSNYGVALTPRLSESETSQILGATGTNLLLSASDIDFSGFEFKTLVSFSNFILPNCNFYGAVFREEAIFTQARFLGDANFTQAEFVGRARFNNAEFCGTAHFQEAKAKATIDFSGTRFLDYVDFHGFSFEGSAHFRSTQFHLGADFSNSWVGKHAIFERANFQSPTEFKNINVAGYARFDRAEFGGPVSFENGNFAENIRFNECKFFSDSNFSAARFHAEIDFSNATFMARTDFIETLFNEAPLFHQSALHQDTSFLGMVAKYRALDPSSRSLQMWDRRARAWRTLKQKMNEVHAHDEERRFFALESDAKSHLESFFSRRLTWAYASISHFGWSILRPFYALVATYALSFGAYLLFMRDDLAPSLAKISYFLTSGGDVLNISVLGQLLAFTATGSIPLFGHKDLAESYLNSLFHEQIHFLIYAISVIQGILSAIFIFLMLLAIRNRYRIK